MTTTTLADFSDAAATDDGDDCECNERVVCWDCYYAGRRDFGGDE
ncbi:hypothetical protein [Haloarchaeobius sp. DFWS5]